MNNLLMIDENGWLKPNRWISHQISPNMNDRPSDTMVDLLVIHHISLPPHHFGGDHVTDFFKNQLQIHQAPFFETIKDLKVSAHVFIKRNGEVIQFVSFNHRAWHAGESCFNHRLNCNDFSIGIELEGDMKTPYRYGQYKALEQIILAIKSVYPIQHMVGHSDISPHRKTDPGPYFDWDRIR